MYQPQSIQVCTDVHLERLIMGEKGRFMGIWSRTKKGLRFFHCRTGVHFGKNLKANPRDAYELPYVTVWDVKGRDYRTINLSEIRTVCCSGIHYRNMSFKEDDVQDLLDWQYGKRGTLSFLYRFFNMQK